MAHVLNIAIMLQPSKGYIEFIKDNPTMVGISERAIRPLIYEQDAEVREEAISHVEKRLKRETPTGGI